MIVTVAMWCTLCKVLYGDLCALGLENSHFHIKGIEAQRGGQPAQDHTVGDGGAKMSVQDFISVSC